MIFTRYFLFPLMPFVPAFFLPFCLDLTFSCLFGTVFRRVRDFCPNSFLDLFRSDPFLLGFSVFMLFCG